VLLVDDDERNLLAVANVLDDLGEVVLARSGEEALRHLLKGEFAVILLDVYMPGMDGYETAQIIRKREQTKGIPIVFLSAVNKEDRASPARIFDGRGRLCLQTGRPGGAAFEGRPSLSTSSPRPRKSNGRQPRSSRSLPSFCVLSRSFAVRSSGRRRSSSRCRWCFISNLSSPRHAGHTM
jgi:CheY-like chemotaxis protein